MMRITGGILDFAHPPAILNAWPVTLTRDQTLYTLCIATPTGILHIDFDATTIERLHHAITMLLNFPRLTHLDFPLDPPPNAQPETPPLDIPLV